MAQAFTFLQCRIIVDDVDSFDSEETMSPIAANNIWNSSEHFSLISEETSLIQFLFINLNGSFMKRTLCLPLHTFSIDFVIVDAMLHGGEDKNAWLLKCSIKLRRLVSFPALFSLFCTGWNLQYDIWPGADVMLGSRVNSWVSPHESNNSFCLDFFVPPNSNFFHFSTELSICSATECLNDDGGVLGNCLSRLCTFSKFSILSTYLRLKSMKP